MHIRFRQTGGFAGVEKVAEVDIAGLPEMERNAAELLYKRTPTLKKEVLEKIETNPDEKLYVIEFETGDESRQLVLRAAEVPEEGKSLVRMLASLATYEKR